MSKEARNT